MNKKIIALFVFGFIALAASLYLTRLHYQIGHQGFDEKSFCNVSDFIDCDTVIASRYSQFKTPVGMMLTSELGVLYYCIFLLGLLYAIFSTRRQETLSFLFFSIIFACFYSLGMAYLSIVKLGVLCLFCFTTYASNFILLLLLPKALGLRYGEVPRFLVRYVKSIFGIKAEGAVSSKFFFYVGSTLAVAAFGLLVFRGINPEIHKIYPEAPREEYLKFFNNLPQKEIAISGQPVWGNEKAKVTIVEFSDFQCPFCKRAAFTLKPYLKEFRDNIRFIYMNYPLDSACNPALKQTMHPVSCVAAKAGICAKKEGKFWDYHDLVFENQKRLSRTTLLDLAKTAGLKEDTFEACLASDEVSQELAKDVEQGGKLDIQGTPTIFINGRQFRDWPNPDRLRMVIESEISQAK